MQNLLITTGFILFWGLGIFQLIIGYMGISHTLGLWWAVAAWIAAIVFRFTLPISIGTYFGVVEVLGWHWIIGILLTIPGILFMIPAIGMTILQPILSKVKRNKKHDL